MQTLTVRVAGGPGIVTSRTPGLRCTGGVCDASFPEGTEVMLTVSGGALRDWSGDCSGRGTCVVTMMAGALGHCPPPTLTLRALVRA